MNCDDVRIEFGAYVLGGLTEAEHLAVDEHLLDCPACAAELSELEELPDVLGRLGSADLASAGMAPSPELFRRTVVAIDSRRHQTRRRATLALAGAVGLAAAGLIGFAAAGHGTPTGRSFTASAGAVTMRVGIRDQPGGTALAVRVDGLPENEKCRLVAVTTTGATESVASWTASYAGEASVSEASSFPASVLSSIRLLAGDGHTLVAVPV